MRARTQFGSRGVIRPGGGIPRHILAAVAIVIGLVALAIAAVVVGSRPPTVYPAGSPEAVFQEFLAADERDDPDAAYALFSSSVQAQISSREYRRAWRDFDWQREQGRRVVLERTEIAADRATLHLRVTDRSSGGLLGGDRHPFERTVRLVHENAGWRLDEPLVGLESVGYLWGAM